MNPTRSARPIVQLVLEDANYAKCLCDLLTLKARHRVFIMDSPETAIDGVVVVDGHFLLAHTELLSEIPERLVVLSGNDIQDLERIWKAGVQHVVFKGDPPGTAELAVMAAELRLARGK